MRQNTTTFKPAGSLMQRLGVSKPEPKSLMKNMKLGMSNLFGHFKKED